jgi:hypothetical protein
MKISEMNEIIYITISYNNCYFILYDKLLSKVLIMFR